MEEKGEGKAMGESQFPICEFKGLEAKGGQVKCSILTEVFSDLST